MLAQQWRNPSARTKKKAVSHDPTSNEQPDRKQGPLSQSLSSFHGHGPVHQARGFDSVLSMAKPFELEDS